MAPADSCAPDTGKNSLKNRKEKEKMKFNTYHYDRILRAR